MYERSRQDEQPLTTQTLAALYDAFGARLYRYAAFLLGDASKAEDVVQDAFVRMARVLDRGTPEVTFHYAAAIVRNECYSTLRRQRRSVPFDDALLERASPDASEEERMILTAALAALPPEQREVVYLKVFEGLTFQEIAERCGIGLNTAASRYRYATAALRKTLAGSR